MMVVVAARNPERTVQPAYTLYRDPTADSPLRETFNRRQSGIDCS
jgi:hypothetical protein